MLQIQTILVAADFSVQSEHAYHLAESLARDHHARLVVAHVAIPPPLISYGELHRALESNDGYRSLLDSRLKSTYRADADLNVDYWILEGDPAIELLEAARRAQCDLIVVGTHGLTGVKRLLLGV